MCSLGVMGILIPDSLRGSSVKIGTIQRRLAWPLRKDDTHKSRSVTSSFLNLPAVVFLHDFLRSLGVSQLCMLQALGVSYFFDILTNSNPRSPRNPAFAGVRWSHVNLTVAMFKCGESLSGEGYASLCPVWEFGRRSVADCCMPCTSRGWVALTKRVVCKGTFA